MKLELFLYFLFFDNDLRVYNHYNNDKEWKFLYNGKETQTIPKDASEIWVTVTVSYNPNGDECVSEFIFGPGISVESVRRYLGGYFYDINNYVNFLLQYYPATRNIEFTNNPSWFKGVYSGNSFTPEYKMTIWYR